MICRLIILVIFNLCLIVTVAAQQQVPGLKSLISADHFAHQQFVNQCGFNLSRFHTKDSASANSIKHRLNFSPDFTANKIPENYYTTHFGFFCKKELEVEKTSRIAFRVRLGSLQYCNKLEGKL